LVEPSKFPYQSNLTVQKSKLSQVNSPDTRKWTIPCAKSDTGSVWMKVLLALIGEQLMGASHLAGVVLTVRPVMDSVIVWGYDLDESSSELLTCQLRKLVERDTNHLIHCTKMDLQSENALATINLNSPLRPGINNKTSSNSKKRNKSASFSSWQASRSQLLTTSRNKKARSYSEKNSAPLRSLSISTDAMNSKMPRMGSPRAESLLLNRMRERSTLGRTTSCPVEENHSPHSEVYVLDSSPSWAMNVSRMVALFFLFLLVLSGFLLTPK